MIFNRITRRWRLYQRARRRAPKLVWRSNPVFRYIHQNPRLTIRLATQLYKQAEKEGILKGWIEDRSEKIFGSAGDRGFVLRRPEPMRETIIDIGADAHQYERASDKNKPIILERIRKNFKKLFGFNVPGWIGDLILKESVIQKSDPDEIKRIRAIRYALHDLGYHGKERENIERALQAYSFIHRPFTQRKYVKEVFGGEPFEKDFNPFVRQYRYYLKKLNVPFEPENA